MQVPDASWKRFEKAALPMAGSKKENVDHTRAALAMCENIDNNVGRLLAALKDNKLERDTIVVYFSDNGPRWNGGMRGIKSRCRWATEVAGRPGGADAARHGRDGQAGRRRAGGGAGAGEGRGMRRRRQCPAGAATSTASDVPIR